MAGSGTLSETTTIYEDANRRVITKADNATPGDQQLISVTGYDQLGRLRLTRQLESDSQNVDDDTAGIKTQTRYFYNGTAGYRLVSNPFRAATSGAANTEATMGWTLTSSAGSGRVSTVQSFNPTSDGAPPAPFLSGNGAVGDDGAINGTATTVYSGQTSTTTDEAGVQRTNKVDGLGRLTQVTENGTGAITSYLYDVLGDVTRVTHAGFATLCAAPAGSAPSMANRSFLYDSLGRLQSACNPESGTTSYTYDNDSNLKTRTDGRNLTKTFSYDPLNRVTCRTYSDSTPGVVYVYSGVQDFLVSETSASSSCAATGTFSYTYSNYDALGRPGAGTQTTNGQTYTFPSVVWTPQGQVGAITYPTGRVVTTSFNQAGQASALTGVLNGTTTPYVNTALYAAHGGLTQMNTNDSVSRIYGYNARLQTASVSASASSGSLLSLGLNYGTSNNNGRLQSQTIVRPGLSVTQTYGYDGVNRLSSASESGNNWSQWYAYDNVGNRAVISNNAGQNSSLIVPNNTPQTASAGSVPFDSGNHWTIGTGACGSGTAAYDCAGNLIRMNTQTLTYDAESRLTSWTDSSANPATAVTVGYDGEGRRITKTSSVSGTTVYVYDPAGNLAVEYGGAAPGANGPVYLTTDHLGSTRLATNGGGCVGAHDYLPFGEEVPGAWGRSGVPCYAQTDTTLKFTGQERDAENGLDNFLARHLAGAQGRFLSVDPDNAGADLGDPQSWNGYGYVGNNPLVNTDPSGLLTLVPCNSSGVNPNDGSANCDNSGDTGDGNVNMANGAMPFPDVFDFSFYWFGPSPTGAGAPRSDSFLGLTGGSTYTAGPPGPACLLMPPLLGNYKSADSEVVPLFQPAMSVVLGLGIHNANRNGVTPQMTSGFRSRAAQIRAAAQARAAGRAAAPPDRSLHQTGDAVDFGAAANGAANSAVIRQAMGAAGLTWGGPLQPPDPPHYQLGDLSTRVDRRMLQACRGY